MPVLSRLRLIAVVTAIAGLLAGLVVGYAAGDEHAANRAASLSRSRVAAKAASVAATVALTQSGGQCSAQIGRALQLGVQVRNQSASGVTLRRIKAVLPLGGLKATSQAWGPCGELPGAAGAAGHALPAGASAWFTVTFKVLVKCPNALPVEFNVDYERRGRAAATRLPGFDDLGSVHYGSCPVTSPFA
jgi:hypothetical protein